MLSEVGESNYRGVIFNITHAIKIGHCVLIGEKVKKEIRLMLEDTP